MLCGGGDGDDVVLVQPDGVAAAARADPQSPIGGGVQDPEEMVVVGFDDNELTIGGPRFCCHGSKGYLLIRWSPAPHMAGLGSWAAAISVGGAGLAGAGP